jgi:hypothetical protein
VVIGTIKGMNEMPLQYGYHPHGYADVQLQATTLSLHHRADANLANLGGKIEAWEAAHGNPTFQLKNITKTNTALAFELSNVYIALRERFHNVRPEYISFATPMGDSTLALAWQYAAEFPNLRSFGIDPFDDVALTEILTDLDPRATRKLRSDVERARAVENPYASGCIDISSLFSSERRYRHLIAYWKRRNARALATNTPLRVPAMLTSPATITLVHEFGHLVEADLMEHDFEAAEYLYAALSYCLLGEWPRSNRQWLNHLINYPIGVAAIPGPAQGDAERRRYVRSKHRLTIMNGLTRYAASNRDEMFAEAFALSYCAADPDTRAKLEPFQAALRDVGVMRRRCLK